MSKNFCKRSNNGNAEGATSGAGKVPNVNSVNIFPFKSSVNLSQWRSVDNIYFKLSHRRRFLRWSRCRSKEVKKKVSAASGTGILEKLRLFNLSHKKRHRWREGRERERESRFGEIPDRPPLRTRLFSNYCSLSGFQALSAGRTATLSGETITILSAGIGNEAFLRELCRRRSRLSRDGRLPNS